MLKKCFLYLTILMFLSGCQRSYLKQSILEPSNNGVYPVAMKPGHGLIVSSLEYSYSTMSSLKGALETGLVILPTFNPTETNESFKLITSDYRIRRKNLPENNQVRVSVGENSIILSAYQLPAGKYRLGMKQASGRIGTIRNSWTWGDRVERPIPYAIFDVKEGEITYIGRHIFRPFFDNSGTQNRSLLMEMAQKDKLEEDIERLYQTRPELIGIQITNGL